MANIWRDLMDPNSDHDLDVAACLDHLTGFYDVMDSSGMYFTEDEKERFQGHVEGFVLHYRALQLEAPYH